MSLLKYHGSFEEKLGKHCGPALAGIKPANLICIKKCEIPTVEKIIYFYNKLMNTHDVYFAVLRECESSCLVLVFRKEKLRSFLSIEGSNRILRREGYPDYPDVEGFIEHLKCRFRTESTVPNEIGVFLGYPHEDVIAFEKEKGKNYLASKYWKVYNNLDEAIMTFERYDKCKDAICRRISNGASIIDIFSKKRQ